MTIKIKVDDDKPDKPNIDKLHNGKPIRAIEITLEKGVYLSCNSYLFL